MHIYIYLTKVLKSLFRMIAIAISYAISLVSTLTLRQITEVDPVMLCFFTNLFLMSVFILAYTIYMRIMNNMRPSKVQSVSLVFSFIYLGICIYIREKIFSNIGLVLIPIVSSVSLIVLMLNICNALNIFRLDKKNP